MRCLILAPLLVACAGPDEQGPGPQPGDDSLYGPENAWYRAPAADVEEAPADATFAVGQRAPNLTLLDQNADTFSLYQFTGKLVVVDVFADPGEQYEEVLPPDCAG